MGHLALHYREGIGLARVNRNSSFDEWFEQEASFKPAVDRCAGRGGDAGDSRCLQAR